MASHADLYVLIVQMLPKHIKMQSMSGQSMYQKVLLLQFIKFEIIKLLLDLKVHAQSSGANCLKLSSMFQHKLQQTRYLLQHI